MYWNYIEEFLMVVKGDFIAIWNLLEILFIIYGILCVLTDIMARFLKVSVHDYDHLLAMFAARIWNIVNKTDYKKARRYYMVLTLKKDKFSKDLHTLFGIDEFPLLSADNAYIYKDGVLTDELSGARYTIGVPHEFLNLTVKVNGAKAVISNKQIQEAKDNNISLYCKFKNAVASPYRIEYGNILSSVTADSVEIIEKKLNK